MQELQLGPGLDAQFGHQAAADLPEHGECLGSLAGPVPGSHEHPGEALVQRVAGQRRGQLGGGLPFPAAGEHARQAVLQHREAFLGQPVLDRRTRSVSGASASAGPFQSASAASNSGMAAGPSAARAARPRDRNRSASTRSWSNSSRYPSPQRVSDGIRERLEQVPQPGHQGLQAGPRGPGGSASQMASTSSATGTT